MEYLETEILVSQFYYSISDQAENHLTAVISPETGIVIMKTLSAVASLRPQFAGMYTGWG